MAVLYICVCVCVCVCVMCLRVILSDGVLSERKMKWREKESVCRYAGIGISVHSQQVSYVLTLYCT